MLQSYWVNYAQHLPSARVQHTAQASALNIWGDVNVSDLNRKKQLELVEKLRAEPKRLDDQRTARADLGGDELVAV